MASKQLTINDQPQNVEHLSSFNVSSGKSGNPNNPEDVNLLIELADDKKEVRGFGRPITPDLTRDIVVEYVKKSDTAWRLLQDITENKITSVEEIKNSPGFNSLKLLLDPSKQVLSGVFGKEIILQMIAAKDCEGIRYLTGEIEGKMTIVLIGVRDVTKSTDTEAVSEPLSGWEYYKQGVFKSDKPTDPEVHLNSLTRTELLEKMGQTEFTDYGDDIVKVLFGAY